MNLAKTLRAAAVVAAAATPLAAAPTAGASTLHPTTQIVGGTQASNPSVVQLQFEQNGGTYGCTGELIDSRWVLTAQHCTDGDTSMSVYFSNSTSRRGTPIAVDRMENSANGDVALVHLSAPAPVKQYMPLADSYDATAGDTGVIEGYGLRANRVPTSGLYKANVSILGESTDAYGGRAIHLRGVNGASNHGDSGGPLIVDGQIVGVCSTGDSADPGSNIHAGSNYANLTDSRQWISDVTGV